MGSSAKLCMTKMTVRDSVRQQQQQQQSMPTTSNCAAQETAARSAQLAAIQGTAATAAAKRASQQQFCSTGTSLGQARKHRGNFAVTSGMRITGSALRVANSCALELHMVSEQVDSLLEADVCEGVVVGMLLQLGC